MGMIIYGTRVFSKHEGYYGPKEECPVCHQPAAKFKEETAEPEKKTKDTKKKRERNIDKYSIL